ncbi:MAG: hypothetical protein JNJ46_33535 [Myxococcales bacterium]|nr:hypothetical protein [Myxococcales bacterium]
MDSSFAPRQEAVPFGWQKLSKDQQDIVRDVHRWLAGFMSKNSASGDSDGKKDNVDFLPRIEFERKSNVLLIDGGRGTGKTSVFLTLLQTWRDALGPASARLPAIEDDDIMPVVQQRRIIPLDILDMQPLSGHPTLLLQLAGRLYRVAERIAKNAGEQAHEYPQRTGHTFPSSLQKWRELARVVAIAQEDDPHLRRSQNNPEDFAIELESAELRRMHLREHWHAFVAELLTDVGNAKYSHSLAPYAPGADPVFIVPIDDADMNPERGVELLELLRSLWHPRVVFLLTGDADLFRTLLFNHYKRVCERMPDIMARNLAHDVLGKVIPPAQRLRCRVQPNEAFKYLKGAAALPPALIERAEQAGLYEAFPRRWRVLRDLEQSIKGIQSTPVDVARVLFEEAVRFSTLSQPDQDHLMSWCFKPARRGSGLRVDESAVTMQPVTAERGGLALDARRAVSWNVSDGEQWSVAVRAEGTENSGGEGLPERIVQSLYLAASLASQPKPASAEPTKGEPTFTRVGRSLSVTNYDLIKSKFSITPIQYEFPWPTPEWVDPIDFYLFLQGWRDALSSQRDALTTFPGAAQVSHSQITAIESLVSWWISAICALAEHKPIPENAWQDPGESRWTFLGRSIARLANSLHSDPKPTAREMGYIEWARRNALFFSAKISGLRVATRNQIIHGWLAELMPAIADRKNDGIYWILVSVATLGQIELLKQASLSVPDVSIGQQIDIAIRTISNSGWKIRTPKEEKDTSQGEVSVEKFKRAINDRYGEVTPIEELRITIDALDPESKGPEDDSDLNATLLQFIRGSDPRSQLRRVEHFKAHLKICLSQLKLSSVPEPLNVLDTETGSDLWTRAKNVGLGISWDVTRKLAELAESNDILAQLSSPMPARDAWKTILVSFLGKTFSRSVRTAAQVIDDFLIRTQISPMTFLSMRAGETHELTPTQRLQTPEIRVTVRELPDALFIDQDQAAVAAELFVKLHDIVVDEEDARYQLTDEPALPDHLSVNYADFNHRIALPGWPSSVDSLLHTNALERGISWLKLGNKPVVHEQNWDPWLVFCGFFMNACTDIRARRIQCHIPDYVNSIRLRMKPESRDSEFLEELYRSLSHTVAEANNSRYAGRRARAIREWVNLAGPLFAAPETGMSSERAARWLRAWDHSPSNTDDPAACKRLSAFRLKRAQLSLGGETTPEKAREFLDGIDAKHPDHPWVRRIEALAKGTQSA